MTPGAGRPLRVLSVIGSMNVGGAERYLSRVAPAIRAHGIDLELCLLERTGSLLPGLESAGVAVHGTAFDARPRSSAPAVGRALAGAIRSVASLVRRQRYDVVQTYLFEADAIGVPGARLGGCQRVIVSRRALHSWRHRPRLIEHLVEQACNAGATELIANSRVVLDDTIAHEPVRPRHLGVVYNGVEIEGIRRANPGSRGPLRLVTVGALAPRKGQVFAIEALALLRDAGVDATLTLVGGGPDESGLRAAVGRLGLEASVCFAGEGAPGPHLAEADIFVLPSRQEGFSNALLEAMAAALPCVATDVGGNREALEGSAGGVVVPSENAAALAGALLSMASNHGQLREMGAANRLRVEERFTLAASVERLARWYREGPLKD